MTNENETVIDAEVVEGPQTAVAVRQAPGELRSDGIFAGIDIRTPEGLQVAITAAHNMLQLVEAVRTMTVQLTQDEDWDEFGFGEKKTVDLSESACERMMTVVGAHIGIVDEKWEWDEERWIPEAQRFVPDKSGHFSVRIRIRISHPMFGIREGIGLATSRDEFLGTKGDAKASAIEAGANPKDVKGRLLEDVSRHSVYQHAYTRAKGNAIRKLLGVKGLRPRQLDKYGIGKAAGSSIDYGASQREKDLGEEKRRPSLRIRDAVDEKIVTTSDCLAWLQREYEYKGDAVNQAPPELLEALANQIDKDAGPVKAAGVKAAQKAAAERAAKEKERKASRKSGTKGDGPGSNAGPATEAPPQDASAADVEAAMTPISRLKAKAEEHGLTLGDLGPRARQIEPGVKGVIAALPATLDKILGELASESGRKAIEDAQILESEASS